MDTLVKTAGLNRQQAANIAKADPADRAALAQKYAQRNLNAQRNLKKSRRRIFGSVGKKSRRSSFGSVGGIIASASYSAATQANYGPGTGRGGKIKNVPAGPSLLDQLRRDGKKKC